MKKLAQMWFWRIALCTWGVAALSRWLGKFDYMLPWLFVLAAMAIVLMICELWDAGHSPLHNDEERK